MAALSVSAGNHGPGPQNVKTSDGPQNNNSGPGTQTNHYIYNVGLKEPKMDETTILRKEKRDCLRSLSFKYMDARKEDISLAHPRTCDWFFQTSQFQQWYGRDNLQSHNGVLWIKGHPGTGKSTLMRHTLAYCEEQFQKTHVIAAHFFNARGESFEKTPLGMLRSLVYQLLDKEPSVYEQFLPLFRDKKQKFNENWTWREKDLGNFLLSKIQHYQSRPLIVLVDALDECEEAHVRDVVRLLETLSVKATGAGVTLRICLSSRHYPHISMKKHLELVVEDTSEHSEDIVIYTRDNLRISDKAIEKELLEKASGVFMWAVLVIKLLNKAYDEGRIEAMHQVLHDVPSDLERVFETLLINDNPDKHETIFMLQFVLVARRLVKPEELYFATLAKTTERTQAWDKSQITPDDIRRRITNSSRGLIEVRKGEHNAVQFIHKSVNDFLIRNKRLHKLDLELKVNVLGKSHECLRSCCMTYITMEAFHSTTDRKQLKAFGSSYPFLEYASNHILHHAEEAEKQQIGQAGFLQCLIEEPSLLEKIRLLHNVFEEYPGSGCARGVSLLYMLAFHGYARLTRALIDKKVNINAQGGVYGNALQAAIYENNVEIAELLLKEGADVHAQGGYYGNALQAAAREGRDKVVELLLRKGADVNAQGGYYGNALQAAASGSRVHIIELLLKQGADVNAQGGYHGNALQAVGPWSRFHIMEILLKQGADVNAQGGHYGNALQLAAELGAADGIKLLLKQGADVNAQGGYYGNALQAATIRGKGGVKGGGKGAADNIKLLLKQGADVNAQGGYYGNALQAAAARGKGDILKLLLKQGADVNAQGGFYGNALQAAAVKGKGDIVGILLQNGADVNCKTEIYGNALQAATIHKHEEIVELLVEAGADTNPPESPVNAWLQTAMMPETQGQFLETLLKQASPVDAGRQGASLEFLNEVLRGNLLEKTIELLLKEKLQANNQWIYDLTCWLAIEWSTGDGAVRLIEKGANPNCYVTGEAIGLVAAINALAAEEAAAVLLDNGADINAPMFYTELKAEGQMPECRTYQYLAWLVLGVFSTLFIISWSYFSEIL